jgi:hypothetical protein
MILHFIPTSDLASASVYRSLKLSPSSCSNLLSNLPPNNKEIGIQAVVEGKPEARQDNLTIFCVGLKLGRGKIHQISFQEEGIGRGRRR